MISNSLQLLGFALFITAFFSYYSDRTGIEYSKHILKGAKMFKDSDGVLNIFY
jgi:hypothetical protein